MIYVLARSCFAQCVFFFPVKWQTTWPIFLRPGISEGTIRVLEASTSAINALFTIDYLARAWLRAGNFVRIWMELSRLVVPWLALELFAEPHHDARTFCKHAVIK